MKKLTNIKLIKQPKGSNLCGACCLAMIMEYFQIPFGGLEDIWNEISDPSPNGRRYCKTYKMGKYAESMNLVSSIIKFKNLSRILSVCEEKQIPAIMNHHSFENPTLGHFTVFVGCTVNSIIIRDPENKKRIFVKYYDVERLFFKKSENDEITGNTIIVVAEKIGTEKEYVCPRCSKVNFIDRAFLEGDHTVKAIICTNCDKIISVS